MKGAYIHATIRAEIKRAWRYQRGLNRRLLFEETGLNWHRLEYEISREARDLLAER